MIEIEASEFPTIEQQLNEYRSRKKREEEKSSSNPIENQVESLNNSISTTDPQVSINMLAEQTKEEIERNETLLWKKKQEDYQKLLQTENLSPIQCTLYDFTKGTENDKRLKDQNFNFIPEGKIQEMAYRREDIKALIEAIANNTHAIINTQQEESKINNRTENIGVVNRRTRSFMCFRNLNRSVMLLLGVFLVLCSVVGLLILTKF